MPLSIHPWARAAAEGAACLQLQSSDAFWAMHGRPFDNQDAITPQKIKQKLNEFARAIPTVNFPQFQTAWILKCCLGWSFEA